MTLIYYVSVTQSKKTEHLCNWLNANKISLNVKKAEMIIFKSKQKKLEDDLKINYAIRDYILLKVLNTWV